jgi:hypothetical protein
MPRKFWIRAALHALTTLLLTIGFLGAVLIIADAVGFWMLTD